MRELYRRIGLALGMMAFAWLYFLADTDASFVVLGLPRDKGASASPLALPARATSPLPVVQIAGRQGERFLVDVRAFCTGASEAPDWRQRVPDSAKGRHGAPQVYFRASEEIVAAFVQQLPDKGAAVLVDEAGVTRVEALVTRLESGDFRLGAGLSDYGPPRAMVYAWRPIAWACLFLGISLYIVIPRAKCPAGAVIYPGWRIGLTDLVWLILLPVFFALPLAIAGGSVQAVVLYPGLLVMFWPLAGISGLLVWTAASCAAFCLTIYETGLEVSTLGTRLFIPYGDVASCQRVVHVSPCWLMRLLWLASFFGSGADKARLAGQASLLKSSVAQGLGLLLRDGGMLCLWFVDSWGNSALVGAEEVERRLAAAGIACSRERREVRGVFTTLRLTPPPVRSKG